MRQLMPDEGKKLALLIHQYIALQGQVEAQSASKLWAAVEKSKQPYKVLNAQSLERTVWLVPFSNTKYRALYRQSYSAAKASKEADPNAILCASYTGLNSDFQAPIYQETQMFPITLRFKQKGSNEIKEVSQPNLKNCQRCPYAKLGTGVYAGLGNGAACQERRTIPCINWQTLVDKHRIEFVLVSAPPTSVESSAAAFHEIEEKYGESAPYHYIIEMRKTSQKTASFDTINGMESHLAGVIPETLHTALEQLSEYMQGKFIYHGKIGQAEPLELMAPSVSKAA